jgi:hypothetical protein
VKSIETRSRTVFATALAAILLVAGCSRGDSDQEQVEANTTQSEVSVPIPTEPAVPAITDGRNSAEAGNLVTLDDIVSEEAQMQEDAEATGMTSRIPPAGQETPVANGVAAE